MCMETSSLEQKAKDFLKLCYSELNQDHLFDKRWNEVSASIKSKGTYELLDFELNYGTKVAWRNSNKCIGRLFWRSMNVFDCRSLNSPEDIFQALFKHVSKAALCRKRPSGCMCSLIRSQWPCTGVGI